MGVARSGEDWKEAIIEKKTLSFKTQNFYDNLRHSIVLLKQSVLSTPLPSVPEQATDMDAIPFILNELFSV